MQRVKKFILMVMTVPSMAFNLSAGEDLGREVITLLDYSKQYGENDSFDYNKGWAGVGFGLGGTQRGAPEKIRIDTVENERVLKFGSFVRNADWRSKENVTSGMYKKQDNGRQDDFFLYSTDWTKEDKPYFFGTFYLGENSKKTTLRATIVDKYGRNHWPGIWHSKNGFYLRTTSGDYYFNVKGAYTGWVSMGLHVSNVGEMEYFIKYGKRTLEETFLAPDFRKTGSQAAGKEVPRIESRRDANIMLSQIIPESNSLQSFSDGRFNAIKRIEYGNNFNLLNGEYLLLDNWSQNFSLKTPSKSSSVYFYIPNQESLINTTGLTSKSRSVWSGRAGYTYVTINVKGDDGIDYPVDLIANKKLRNRNLKAEDGVQRGYGQVRLVVDKASDNYLNLPKGQSYHQVLQVNAQGWHDQEYSEELHLFVEFFVEDKLYKWGS